MILSAVRPRVSVTHGGFSVLVAVTNAGGWFSMTKFRVSELPSASFVFCRRSGAVTLSGDDFTSKTPQITAKSPQKSREKTATKDGKRPEEEGVENGSLRMRGSSLKLLEAAVAGARA